jgi:hypothetical protein
MIEFGISGGIYLSPQCVADARNTGVAAELAAASNTDCELRKQQRLQTLIAYMLHVLRNQRRLQTLIRRRPYLTAMRRSGGARLPVGPEEGAR